MLKQLPLYLDSAEDSYEMCVLTVVGLAFLYHQVRCMMAILFLVGQGHEQPEVITDMLDIARTPKKPQYGMASEIPLVLYDCAYDDVPWAIDEEAHRNLIDHLQQIWSTQNIKVNEVEHMLKHLDILTPMFDMKSNYYMTEDGNSSAHVLPHMNFNRLQLIQGSKTKIYRPILERPVCEISVDQIQPKCKKQKCDTGDDNGS